VLVAKWLRHVLNLGTISPLLFIIHIPLLFIIVVGKNITLKNSNLNTHQHCDTM